jgi:hypothetical protein
MRLLGEEAKTEESARGGAWPIGRLGAERAQEARESGERPQGRLGQKPQEDYRRPAQCSPPSAGTAQERLSASIVTIRTRFGRHAIGLGDAGIRYAAFGLR